MSETPPPDEASEPRGFGAYCRRNPVVVVCLVVGAVAGAVGAVALPFAPEDMSTTRRILGGAFAGAWLAMFPLGFRLFE